MYWIKELPLSVLKEWPGVGVEPYSLALPKFSVVSQVLVIEYLMIDLFFIGLIVCELLSGR